METRGITTGFDFLENEAGFGILMSVIDYDETYSYGRTFFVGLLNTVLVSVLGIFIATILGFSIGVARLSSNWLIAKVAMIYIEVLRNIPLLLQIFFWYFAVLQVLPSPRGSMTIGESVFFNNRGLYIPRPIFEDGFFLVVTTFLAGVAVMPFVARTVTDVQVIQLSSLGLLIVVGVILDTMKQLEAQLVMRRYEGFIK